MGLTANSTGFHVTDYALCIDRKNAENKLIALAGNPNVGKSTIFNALTGLNQHTGNWPGKTVTNAQGGFWYNENYYIVVDLPGTYSLMAHSKEEEVARNFICFGGADIVILVCDATCLERNLNLVYQTLEITRNVIVCVNLMDEANKKGIQVDLELLESILNVPVIGTSARKNDGLIRLKDVISNFSHYKINRTFQQTKSHLLEKTSFAITYQPTIEEAIQLVEPILHEILSNQMVTMQGSFSHMIEEDNDNLSPNKTMDSIVPSNLNIRFLALRLLDYEEDFLNSFHEYMSLPMLEIKELRESLKEAQEILKNQGFNKDSLRDSIVSSIIKTAEHTSHHVINIKQHDYSKFDRKLDKILTSKLTGIPIMIVLLCIIFWITIVGANYPSELLSKILFWIQDKLTAFFLWLGTPSWVHGILVLGIYRVLAWVVSVMLPPMAIFFPLFTLLEDFGYLPRVAFNLDHRFKKCNSCGKQALTMCLVDLWHTLIFYSRF